MAYLGNTVINGSLRCLNKSYFGDISVSGTTTFASLEVTGNATISGGTLTVGNSSTTSTLYLYGKNALYAMDSWLRINSASSFSQGVYVPSLFRTDGKFQVGANGNRLSVTTGAATFGVPISATTANVTNINSSTISNSSKITSYDVEVTNELKSYTWDIAHVANLANDFTVSPTLQLESGATITFSSINTSTNVCQFTVSDSSSISSSSLGGVTWTQYSKVKFTMELNGVLNTNCSGYLTAQMNSTSGTMQINGTLDTVDGLATGTAYSAEGATIMLYEVGAGSQSTTYPIGIRMTAYGSNKRSYIDIYGGTSASSWTTPHVRIGNVGGLTFNGSTLDNQWGIYTDMGYFSGAIVSTEGKIGGFTIGASSIYNGTNSLTSTTAGIYLGTNGIRNYQSSTAYVNIASGVITAKGANITGQVTATSGYIGNGSSGFTINNTSITNGKTSYSETTNNGIYLGTDGIGLGKGLFYVTSAGALTAKSATIGGWSVNSTSIYSTASTATIYGNTRSSYNSGSGFYLGGDGKFGVGNGTTSYITYDGSSLNMNVTALSIGGTSAATTTDTTNAAKTATNYLTYDSTNGIKLHNLSDTTDYLQVNSTAIRMYRNNVEKMYLDDSSFRIGSTGSGNYNTYITSSGIALRVNTTTLANFTSSNLSYYYGTTGKTAMSLGTSNLTFYETDGSTVAATLGSNGLAISAGSISLGNNFSVDSTGSISASDGTIGGWNISNSSLVGYSTDATPPSLAMYSGNTTSTPRTAFIGSMGIYGKNLVAGTITTPKISGGKSKTITVNFADFSADGTSPFTQIPIVVVCPRSSAPWNCVAGAYDITTTSFKCTIKNESSTSMKRSVNFIAYAYDSGWTNREVDDDGNWSTITDVDVSTRYVNGIDAGNVESPMDKKQVTDIDFSLTELTASGGTSYYPITGAASSGRSIFFATSRTTVPYSILRNPAISAVYDSTTEKSTYQISAYRTNTTNSIFNWIGIDISRTDGLAASLKKFAGDTSSNYIYAAATELNITTTSTSSVASTTWTYGGTFRNKPYIITCVLDSDEPQNVYCSASTYSNSDTTVTSAKIYAINTSTVGTVKVACLALDLAGVLSMSGDTEVSEYIQCGQISITPKANTPTSKTLTFPTRFGGTPIVICGCAGTVPGTTVKGWGVTSVSSKSAKFWTYRTNTTAVVLNWVAVDIGAILAKDVDNYTDTNDAEGEEDET